MDITEARKEVQQFRDKVTKEERLDWDEIIDTITIKRGTCDGYSIQFFLKPKAMDRMDRVDGRGYVTGFGVKEFELTFKR